MAETLSDYENEQIQRILQKDINDKKIYEREKEMISQNLEYEKALAQDLLKEKTRPTKDSHCKSASNVDFEEPSIDEVRRVRLLRFDKRKINKDKEQS
jgi:hypothetical protein